ncbi:MAG: EamA family transporter [Clostridia bacterium]|nr:EamA family transporter [Clostridia bacterium]
MTKELVLYSLILLGSVFISSISQILLKKGAEKEYPSKIREYLNPYVMSGYALFFGCTLLSMYALKVVPLSMAPLLEAFGYIFVAVLSFVFLKEKFTKRQLLGTVLIMFGVVLYSLG